VSKIYIYREFGYRENKEVGDVRQEVPIPKITKGDLNLSRLRVPRDQGRRVGRQEVLLTNSRKHHDRPQGGHVSAIEVSGKSPK
jgi:hypothetical protein